MNKLHSKAAMVIALFIAGNAPMSVRADAGDCGSLETHYGPFDYRTARGSLPIVEKHHFTAQVESLVSGQSGTVLGDLDYTLRAFPNHHRALAAVVRYGEREKSRKAGTNLDKTIDCYFDRALRFRTDDSTVRLLFADHLGKTKREDEAAAQLAYVKVAVPDNPLTQYNVGLLYFQLGRYKEALAQAHLAAEMGVPRTDLMDKLKAKGQWIEPQPAAKDNAAPAASTPAS